MKIEISDSGEEVIELFIARGVCKDAEEVVDISLRALNGRNEAQLKALREDVAVGVAAIKEGRVAPFDTEEIKREGRKRHDSKHHFA